MISDLWSEFNKMKYMSKCDVEMGTVEIFAKVGKWLMGMEHGVAKLKASGPR